MVGGPDLDELWLDLAPDRPSQEAGRDRFDYGVGRLRKVTKVTGQTDARHQTPDNRHDLMI